VLKLKGDIYFSGLIGFVEGTYLLVATSSMLNLRQAYMGVVAKDVNFWIAVASVLGVVIGYPLFLLLNYIVCRPADILENEEF
jgi:hypothetical protein